MKERRLLRKCCAGGGRACLFGLNLGLTLLAALQGVIVACLLAFATIPVPAPVTQWAEESLAEAGFRASWDSLSANLTGEIEVHGFALFDRQSEQCILRAERIHADLDLLSRLLGGPLPLERLRLENATLYGPPEIVPDPEAPLANLFAADLELRGQTAEIRRMLGTIGSLRLSASGRYGVPSGESSEATEDDWHALWLRSAERLLQAADHLATVSGAALHLAIGEQPSGDQPQIDLTGIVDRWEASDSIQASGLYFTWPDLLAADRSLSPHFTAQLSSLRWKSVPYPLEGMLHASRIAIRLTGEPIAFGDWSIPGEIQWSSQLEHSKLPATELFGELALAPLPDKLQADLRLQTSSLSTTLGLEFDRLNGDGSLKAQLDGDPDALLKDPALHLAAVAEATDFSPRFHAQANARFAAGAFEGVDFSLEAGEFRTLENFYDEARLTGRATSDRLVVGPIEAFDPEEQSAYGYYAQDLNTQDYRILARGEIFPHRLDSLLPPFYRKLWTFIEPGTFPAQADVDVRSRWGKGNGRTTNALVAVRGHDAAYRGEPVDRFDVWLRQATGFVRLEQLTAEAPGGTLSGQIDLLYPYSKSPQLETHADLHSTLPLSALDAIFGETAAKLESVFAPSAPPDLQLHGVLRDFADDRQTQDFTITVARTAPLVFSGVPLDWIETTAHLTDDGFNLNPLRLGFAGGTALADAEISYGTEGEAGQYRFTAHLEGANYVDTLIAFSEPSSEEAKPDDSPSPHEELRQLPPEEQGVLNLFLEARGPLDDWKQATGGGEVELIHAPLGKVNLFGELSKAFGRVFGLSVGSFRLDTLESSLVLAPGYVGLPDLVVRGPSVKIESTGRVAIPSRELGFDAKVFFLNSESPSLQGLFGVLLRPLGHAFEVAVSGPLDAPQWRFKNNPLGLLRPTETTPPTATEKPKAHPAEAPEASETE